MTLPDQSRYLRQRLEHHPDKQYLLKQPLVITAADAPLLAGEGRTTLVWDGPADVPMIKFINCPEVTLKRVDCLFSKPCHTAFQFHRQNAGMGVRPATLPTLEDVRFFGDGKLRWPVRFTYEDQDANNEHGVFQRCSFYGYSEYAVDIEGKQSKEHRFYQCRSEGGRGAVRAPSAFMWEGGTVSGASHAAFLLHGGGGDRVVIKDVGVEASARVLLSSERTTAGWKVTLDNVRFAADQLAPDGDWVQFYSTGPLTVKDCQVGGGAQPRVPTIGIASSAQCLVSVHDNFFDTFGASELCPVRTFEGGRVVVSWGLNHYRRGANDDPNCVTLGAWGLQASGDRI